MFTLICHIHPDHDHLGDTLPGPVFSTTRGFWALGTPHPNHPYGYCPMPEDGIPAYGWDGADYCWRL
jgi:hypothetical protein